LIESFGNEETQLFFTTAKSRRLPPEILKRTMMRLAQLDAATEINDLRQPPSNRLESLSGDRLGQWSVRINNRWRICFAFAHGNAQEVEIVDYH